MAVTGAGAQAQGNPEGVDWREHRILTLYYWYHCDVLLSRDIARQAVVSQLQNNCAYYS